MVGFEQYVAGHGRKLLRLAFLLTRDTYLAEDLTQSVLADAYRHWSKVDAAAHPDAYVHRMLINAYVSRGRRRSSREAPSESPARAAGAVDDPAEEIVERDRIRRLLDTLAPRARTVLVLRYYSDLTDAAIADLLGISESGVRATASRALQLLRDGRAVDCVEEQR